MVTSSTQLAGELARFARALEVRVLAVLRQATPIDCPLRRLFVDRGDDRAAPGFADGFAQTVSYGLLARRWLPGEHAATGLGSLLAQWIAAGRACTSDPGVGRTLAQIEDLLANVDLEALFADQPDPSLHFYQDFLQAYDPALRRRQGVYYTPDAVAAHMVDTVHAVLQRRFGLRLGLADASSWGALAEAGILELPASIDPDAPFVQVLDPAAGTGAFLLRVIAVIHATMQTEYARRGLDADAAARAWNDDVRRLLPRLHGHERMLAPAVIGHLRLALALRQTGFVFTADDPLPIRLTDTLAPPTDLADQAAPPITVILGNPPYAREAAAIEAEPGESGDGEGHDGGWIRDGWPGWDGGRPPLDDYAAPARAAGAGGHLKNLYNLYVYFWRWACWRVFDAQGTGVGVVCLLTPASFLRGPGFVGMREALRRVGEEIAIVNLEGDQRGARSSDNVFPIKTPVCVTTVLATAPRPEQPAVVRYRRLTGDRAQKLAALAELDLDAGDWLRAPGQQPVAESIVRGFAAGCWGAELMAVAVAEGEGGGDFGRWPALAELFPWQLSGCKAGRTWVIGETRELLQIRWSTLLASAGEARVRGFKNSPTGKRADRSARRLPPGRERDPAILELPADAPTPAIVRFAVRSFDRQWILADARLLDRPGPGLWAAHGDAQLYLTCPLSGMLGPGPAATVCAEIPDLHHFCGRGGRDVIPLWRDAAATQANVNEALLDALARVHGRRPQPEALFAYAYAVLANPGYVRRFEAALQIPGPRLPISEDPVLFDRGVTLGRSLLAWHSFGARFVDADFAVHGEAAVRRPIQAYPQRCDHSGDILRVGAGEIAPVDPAVWAYTVSGLQVVKSWLDYRMLRGAGRRSSPLDQLRPSAWTAAMTRELLELLWVLAWTVDREPVLDAWLTAVLDGPCLGGEQHPRML